MSLKDMSPGDIGQQIAETIANFGEEPLPKDGAADFIAGYCAADGLVVERGSMYEAALAFAYFDAEVESGRLTGAALDTVREAAAEWYHAEAKRSQAVRQF